MKNNRVDIIYTHYPHYREPVFLALSRSEEFRFRFYFDHHGTESTIKSGSTRLQSANMRSYRFSNFVFQPGAVGHSFVTNASSVIYLGNPNILSNWICAIILRMRGKRVYFWTHGWLKMERGVKGLVRDLFYKLAHGLMLYGERSRSIGIKRGFRTERLHVIYNSLDFEHQRAIRSANPTHPTGSSVAYFLCVGRLVPALDLKQTILAAAVLREAGMRFKLIVVGDGPERETLAELAKKKDVPVDFLGAVYDEVLLASLFLGAVAVVSPGKVGLLALHAAAYGVPVITHADLDHQMPEIEILDKLELGIYFKRGAVHALAERMGNLIVSDRGERDDKRIDKVFEAFYSPAAQKRLIEQVLLL